LGVPYGRAVRSRFFLNCPAFKGRAIQKKSSTSIPNAKKSKKIKNQNQNQKSKSEI
jgi:hypothetical protein